MTPIRQKQQNSSVVHSSSPVEESTMKQACVSAIASIPRDSHTESESQQQQCLQCGGNRAMQHTGRCNCGVTLQLEQAIVYRNMTPAHARTSDHIIDGTLPDLQRNDWSNESITTTASKQHLAEQIDILTSSSRQNNDEDYRKFVDRHELAAKLLDRRQDRMLDSSQSHEGHQLMLRRRRLDHKGCARRSRRLSLLEPGIVKSALLGGIFGGSFALLVLLGARLMTSISWDLPQIVKYPIRYVGIWPSCPSNACPAIRMRNSSFAFSTSPVHGIQTYLDLFDRSIQQQHPTAIENAKKQPRPPSSGSRSHRKLADTAQWDRDSLLVIAGKMTVLDGPCNIAQYDLKTNEWSISERIQLSLYNSYSGGEVYSILANYTIQVPVTGNGDDGGPYSDGTSSHSKSSAVSGAPNKTMVIEQVGSGELIVVGAFDTTYRNSQVTYCSVGRWDGAQLSKVGEGLCNSALSKGMKITSLALAGLQDIYVAGSFQTQVWNGDRHEFVKIFNIAHFNAVTQVWLPLPVGQITCSWCTVTVLALAWDGRRRQLHVAGKFDAIDGLNVPAGLAIFDYDSGHLVAHPGGGLSMLNATEDGVGTALQLDEASGVLYVMGSFERLTATSEICLGLAAYEIEANRWTCIADSAHSVVPTGGGNMLLTPYGLMVAGKTTSSTTWPDGNRPYTIALLTSTLKTRTSKKHNDDDFVRNDDELELDDVIIEIPKYHDFNWSWLPGFKGSQEPLHALSNGFGPFEGTVFIVGDSLVARWSYEPRSDVESDKNNGHDRRRRNLVQENHSRRQNDRKIASSSSISGSSGSSSGGGSDSSHESSNLPYLVPRTVVLSEGVVRGAIMAVSQLMPPPQPEDAVEVQTSSVNITIIVYCVSVGCVIGVIGAVLCNRNASSSMFPFIGQEKDFKGFTLDTLTYSALENTHIMEAYRRAMQMRYVQHPNLLTVIDPQEIFLQRIIGEGTFGRVWSARWRSASVAVKEFVFAQAAVAGRSAMQQEIIEEIIGEAGMMAILRHPNVLQLFGCSLTAQAIWIVSELCSLGSLRQLLDDNDRVLPVDVRLSLALQVAEGMTYLHNQDPPIIHRDLKSHNIFVHETFTDSASCDGSPKSQSEKMETHSTIVAKIGDWGSARATLSGSRTMTHGVGTACWLAPEVIKHARSSKYSDVYGYGIVLWELATREEVYQGLETTQIIAKVANENLRPPVPQDCPWKDIMVKCWAENPLDRLEFADIMEGLNDLSVRLRESPNHSDENGATPIS